MRSFQTIILLKWQLARTPGDAITGTWPLTCLLRLFLLLHAISSQLIFDILDHKMELCTKTQSIHILLWTRPFKLKNKVIETQTNILHQKVGFPCLEFELTLHVKCFLRICKIFAKPLSSWRTWADSQVQGPGGLCGRPAFREEPTGCSIWSRKKVAWIIGHLCLCCINEGGQIPIAFPHLSLGCSVSCGSSNLPKNTLLSFFLAEKWNRKIYYQS